MSYLQVAVITTVSFVLGAEFGSRQSAQCDEPAQKPATVTIHRCAPHDRANPWCEK